MTATTMEPTIDGAVDASDLDLLDDTCRHARCTICTGTTGPLVGVPFTALCGRRAINMRPWDDLASFPPDACPECVVMFDGGACPTCGSTA